ncbi:hypothetical protein BVX98_00405, partial [bacterium F11]
MNNKILFFGFALFLTNPFPLWGALPNWDANPILGDWVPNGGVTSIETHGDKVYIGGEFNLIGPFTRSITQINKQTGNKTRSFAEVNGTIEKVVSDGNGGWYIAGSFTRVGGAEISTLAHLNADGSVDANWNPVGSNQNVTIYDMHLYGNTLIVAGRFWEIGGAARVCVAGINAQGQATDLSLPIKGDSPLFNVPRVKTLALDGDILFIGGAYGIERSNSRNLLAYDILNETWLNWDPDPKEAVEDIALLNSKVYAVGNVVEVGAFPPFESRTYGAAWDRTNNFSLTSWDPQASAKIEGLTIAGNNFIAHGVFSTIGSKSISYLAELDSMTGLATDWNPYGNAVVSIRTIQVDNNTVIVGGSLTPTPNTPESYIHFIDRPSGIIQDVDPRMGGPVYDFKLVGDDVLAVGDFHVVNGVRRSYLARLNSDRSVDSWNPDPNGRIQKMIKNEGLLYIGGYFENIAGQPCHQLAVHDLSQDLVTPFGNPPLNGHIKDFSMNDTGLYVIGDFTEVDGEVRNGLAAFSRATAELLPWQVELTPSGANEVEINAIEATPTRIFIGGHFERVGDSFGTNLGAADPITGESILISQFFTNGEVEDLAIEGNRLYIAGNFYKFGPPPTFRTYAASFDINVNLLTSWRPFIDNPVRSIFPKEDAVFVSGDFNEANNTPQSKFAVFDTEMAHLLSWAPEFSIEKVKAVKKFGNTLLVGGGFTRINETLSTPHLTQFNEIPGETIETNTPPVALDQEVDRWGDAPFSFRLEVS